MTSANPPSGPSVRLVQLPAAVFTALAAGDLAAADELSPVPLTAYFAGPDWASVWRRRAAQLITHPEDAGWITRVIWDPTRRAAVGRAGFHGAPDRDGMVEIGYAVAPAWRRQGYARAAFEQLLNRARAEPAVRTVRVTISPANTASRALALPYGFVPVGEQQDDEDGLELVYEVAADGLRA
ncbi:GNAT family N-acetyltransferase [Modestobacter sp. VKM Ac-2977]|uniref:GNAT family N-acetyltransferase n=1 Tax=Modestobacter sp. VKM Ac-2977 TaxID=3004131 RepID=UPI0022AA909D|nr:GNAT family N-acetyltransferase [Modestobacter sp. VKM Ac-2977]MCZ2822419.1 GNAT family N-acetyltransferase [Modestobacter sp. VKM Ac-2977]